MIQLNQANFSIQFQEMLEKYYLQPLDGSYKKPLKNGYIERRTHGAQHASRATMWALIMHKHLQKLVPEYVNASLEKIAQHIGVHVEEVVLLILMTMGCHDAARKGEDQDIWESQSAAIVLDVLKESGLEEPYAKLFSAAVQFKDRRGEYINELKKQGILGLKVKDYNQFDYIRKIINLGDTLDAMRCIGLFQSKYLFDTLETVEGFNENHHDVIINLIKEIHQFIYDQQDMLFACTVKDLENNDLVSRQSHLSKKQKVTYEHAENVFAAVFEDALNNQEFEPFINDFSVPETKKYEGNTAFDPFIHGTNTSILSILPKSDFQIMSPLEMMDDYQAVPMTGELTAGGYDVVGSTLIKEGTMGKTSFGIMSANNINSYTFYGIISSYTRQPVDTGNDSLQHFKDAVQSGFKEAFSNINLLLIYFTRARQMHDLLEHVITTEQIKTLQDKMEATSQFFYFIQLLGTYINLDVAAIKKSGMKDDIRDAAYTFLTFENIVDTIIKNKIDMKEIVTNPTPENLGKALAVLQLPEKCTITSYFSRETKNIALPITQFFCIEPDFSGKTQSSFEPVYSFYRMSQNLLGFQINTLLKYFILGSIPSSFFVELGKEAKQHLTGFDDRVRLFEKLVKTPQSQFKLTSVQHYFLQRIFPMMLVSENEENMSLFDFTTDEYRSKNGLKLGKEIKIIATDTHNHRLEIMKYLDLHHINNVQVVLFHDLQKSKQSKEKPSTPYHHEDGGPTLKWMCAKWLDAKKESVREVTFFKPRVGDTNSTLNCEKNVKEVEQLLEDAQKYQSIDFII